MKLVKGLFLAATMLLSANAMADCANTPVALTCTDILGSELTGSVDVENTEVQVYDRFLNDEDQGYNTVAKPLVLVALFELAPEEQACMAAYMDAIEPLLGCAYARNFAAADEAGRAELEAGLRDFANTQIGAIALSETKEAMMEAVFGLYTTVSTPAEQ